MSPCQRALFVWQPGTTPAARLSQYMNADFRRLWLG
jgi:hypothetical protein